MTAVMAIPLKQGGKEEISPVKSPSGDHGVKKEGDEGQVVPALVRILGSADPETALLGAITDGVIPDEICLELAEYLGELVKAANFDNRIETVFALRKSEAISEVTEGYLLLAILEMDEQEEVSALAETETPIQTPTFESPAPAPQTPIVNLVADLIRSAAELQKQFGTNLPDDERSEIRQAVGKLTEEEFNSLRQTLGSAILAQAEFPADRRQIDVAASLEVVEILLGQRQAELTAATFTTYVALTCEGFRLTHRNGHDRPLMTVSSMTILRNYFQRWLDSHGSSLDENELASAQKAAATLEGFLLAAADDRVKTVIQQDRATRLRERIVSSRVRALDAISEELIARQPATKEAALQQVQGCLNAKRRELASELRAARFASLGEAEAVIRQIFDLHSSTTALRRELAELNASDYDRLAQRPVLTNADKRLAYLELERKELDSIRAELETALKEGTEANRDREKLQIVSVITAGKLRELDQLIAGLRPAPEVRHG